MNPLTIIILGIIFLVCLVAAYFLGSKIGSMKQNKYWEGELPGHRKDAIMRSRAVLGGHFSEQLAPYLPDFEYLPTECRFIGKPIDFLVFKGMDGKDIKEVVFVEVKSGNAKLTSHEKKLKDVIDKKKVKWVEYRIPKGVTEEGDVMEKVGEFLDG